MKGPDSPEGPRDFSVVLGGPTFQFFRRLHLSGDELELLNRRLVVIVLFAWLPLLILVMLASPSYKLGLSSFLRDVEVHVRFLVALPVLIAAELTVHRRLRPLVRRFVDLNLVVPRDLSSFYSSVASAIRWRNSVPAEIVLLLFVYSVGPILTLRRISLNTSAWYAMPAAQWHLTPAGFWYVFVSIPIIQFFLVRWYMRLFIWFRFLWQVSRLDLHLIPTHPDRSAGLGFLGKSAYAFSPILFAEGAMLSGLIATEVLYHGVNLRSFKWEVIAVGAFFIFAILGPLVMFTPRLAQTKRQGLADYGTLAQRYVEGFERKWILDGVPPSEKLLGVSDIQSLADLGNSYAMVREMSSIPFRLQDVSRLAAATAAPLVPLMLTVFSPEELMVRLYKILL